MILAFALAAAVLFGCGAYLLLKRDLVRVVAGIMLISQCAMVTIIGASLSRGRAAIGVQPGDHVSDPLPQALALTAIVISFGITAFLLSLAYRSWVLHRDDEVEDDLEDRRIAQLGEQEMSRWWRRKP